MVQSGTGAAITWPAGARLGSATSPLALFPERFGVLRTTIPARVRVHDCRDVQVVRLGRRLGKERACLARQRHSRVRALVHVERQTEVFHQIVDREHRRLVLPSYESRFARFQGRDGTADSPENRLALSGPAVLISTKRFSMPAGVSKAPCGPR